MTGYESKRAAAQDKLAQPAQEPNWAWATKEDFYRELDRRVERMRKEMEIKTVTMRCKDYDVALNIVDMYGGHVVVGQVSFPPQPAQEPVTWGVDWGKAGDIPCVSIIKRVPNGGIEVMAVEYAPYSYTAPPQRPWVGLTDTEIDAEANSILTSDPVQWWRRFARAVLAKSREKNNGT